uniref:helix-turn-helix domain-containing protein n=1 Tax=Arthrobacter sp. 35/47 TaxID=269454 RepID=UPI0012EB0DB1
MKKTWFLPEQWDKFYAVLCSGASFSEAARVAGVSRNGAAYQWRKTGGMTLMTGIPGGLADPPTSVGTPGTGRLSLVERATIMVRLRDGKGHAEIGRELGRDRTVIWREIKRNTNPDGSYQADLAHARAHQRAHRPKAFKLTAMNHDLLRFIEDALEDGWSPKLISLVLAKDYADDKSMQISHETIYQCLYVQSRGELRKDLYRYLSLSRPKRVSRENQHAGGRAKPYRDALKI